MQRCPKLEGKGLHKQEVRLRVAPEGKAHGNARANRGDLGRPVADALVCLVLLLVRAFLCFADRNDCFTSDKNNSKTLKI